MQWFALFRPGSDEPVAADVDKSDLISVALRRTGEGRTPPGNRDAAWKRLRRRGWRLELLPGRFWEAREKLSYQLLSALQRVRKEGPTEAETRNLLRELAEDRHDRCCCIAAGEGILGQPQVGHMRTCPSRLCGEAAELLR